MKTSRLHLFSLGWDHINTIAPDPIKTPHLSAISQPKKKLTFINWLRFEILFQTVMISLDLKHKMLVEVDDKRKPHSSFR